MGGYQTCDCQSQARTKDQLLFLNITILHNIVMASRIVKSPAVQTTAKRQFAAQAAVARSERELVKAEPLKVSTLKNGLNVASIENHSPITTLGVILKAGSRSETHDNAGISHSLRIAAGLGTKTKTAFSICRNLQQVGASMVATQAVELLHQAAFRGGLGNSLYCPTHKVGSHGTAQLSQFVSKHFTTNRAALLGVGVSHSALTKFADLLHLDTGAGPSATATKYSAGELRVETGGGLAYVALAANTAGVVNVADCMAALLLQRVLGMGASVKYGTGQGKLAQA